MLFTASTILTILLSLVEASPVPSPSVGGTVTLLEGKPRRSFAERQLLSGQSLTSFIESELQQVKGKWESNVEKAKAAIADGSVNTPIKRAQTISLTDYGGDELYYGTLGFGTPAQQLTFDFDTGSSDVWIPTTKSNAYNDGTHYDPSKSSTYRDAGKKFSDSYGSGQVSGELAIETVKFGSLVSTNQYFGAVTTVSSSFDNNPATGLCGLAYQSLASTGHAPLPMNLYNEGQISSPEFGIRLTAGTSQGAELTMGGVASDYAGSSFAQTPVTSRTYYEVNTNGMTVQNQVVTGSFPAAIDTGTTLLYVPTSAASAFYGSIPGSSSNGDGSYNYPCNYAGPVGISFPNIGNLNFNVNDLNIGSNGDGTCVGAVMGQDIQDANGNNFAIVGDTFIKSYYTVFNFGSNYVAFTPAHSNT